MQESGGKGNDPMQAAECEFNTKYPHVPNGIQDPVYSIEVGIQNFAECLTVAKVLNINDTNNLYLALQGYNYGKCNISLGHPKYLDAILKQMLKFILTTRKVN